MRRLPLQVIALAVAFAGVVIGGTTAWWGFPPVALAASDCTQDPLYHMTDVMRTNGVLHVDRGVRASTEDHVYAKVPGFDCVQVDSVVVEHPDTLDYVEVGWGTFEPAYGNCSPASAMDDTPKVMFSIRVGGKFLCTLVDSISIQAGDTPFVAVKSNYPSYPKDWIFTYSGNQLAYAESLPFATGSGLTNCDRHYMDPNDPTVESCQAHFVGMQYRSSASNGVWTNWGSEICSDGQNGTFHNMNDPAYYNHLTQPNEVTVSTNSNSPC